MKRSFWGLAAALLFSTPASAQKLNVDIDISRAERLLELACSKTAIDEREFRNSPLVQSQIKHHSAFAPRFSMDNYVDGARMMANCETPEPDPFRFKSLVEKRPVMEKAINLLVARREDLIDSVHKSISPYVPDDFAFEGKVILAAASFSCGGFSVDGAFFIDLPCLAGDIEGEYEAIAKLIAHEAYHAMQNEFASKSMVEEENIETVEQAWDYMFHRLAIEGSASHIGDMRDVSGEGRYTKFSRSIAKRSFRHLDQNFQLFGYMMEAIASQPANVKTRFPQIYGLAFDGGFGELSYFTGQQMTAEIAHSFGTKSIPCILALSPENFALAYRDSLADGDNLKQSSALSSFTLKAAEKLAKPRPDTANIAACLKAPVAEASTPEK